MNPPIYLINQSEYQDWLYKKNGFFNSMLEPWAQWLLKDTLMRDELYYVLTERLEEVTLVIPARFVYVEEYSEERE